MSSKKSDIKEQLSKEELKKQKKEKKEAKKAKIAAMSVKQRKKYYLKQAVIVVGASFLILCALCFILWAVNGLLPKSQKNTSANVSESRVINVPYEHPTYPAFPIDYDKNVYDDEKFKELNLDLTYEELESGLVYTLDYIIGAEHEGHRFFRTYFEMLRSGNYKIYPSLFAESYVPETSYEQNINREFPPQMVYDVKIDEIGRQKSTYNGKSCVRGIYTVNYRILENDLLFRRDIGYDSEKEKDVARALIFELITFDYGKPTEKTYIHNLYTETSLQNK